MEKNPTTFINRDLNKYNNQFGKMILLYAQDREMLQEYNIKNINLDKYFKDEYYLINKDSILEIKEKNF